MGGALEGDRRHENRHGHLLSEDRRRRVDPRDVDEHARAQKPPSEGRDVVGERELVGGAAGVVGERRRVERLGGGALVVEEVEELQAP
jgi:hypothetical protein